MNENYLLIKTKDRRKFLTYEKHLGSLIEFAKTFGAEISIVIPEDGQKVMDLKSLTTALCDSDYHKQPKYRVLSKVYPKSKRSRNHILKSATVIRKYIKSQLLLRNSVSLKQLKAKFKEYDLTDACLCNHLSVIRKMLIKQGHEFHKVGAGKYCLSE
jgi:hypothetical protein